jgi:acyl carrier protein
MADDIQSKVIAIIAQQLHISAEDITPDSMIESLGADSLDFVELVMKFEEEFGVEINDEDAQKLHTVADVVAYIQRLKR